MPDKREADGKTIETVSFSPLPDGPSRDAGDDRYAEVLNASHQGQENVLRRIAREDPDPVARALAVAGCDDPQLAGELLRRDSDPSVRWNAILQVPSSDVETLRFAALNDPDRTVRGRAVRALDDQEVLARVAATDADPLPAQAATERLDNQELLDKVARNSPHSGVRILATQRLTSVDLLEGLAFDADHHDTRMTATEHIGSQELLAEIAKHDIHGGVRRAAVSRLDDRELLTRIAARDPSQEVRQAAQTRARGLDQLEGDGEPQPTHQAPAERAQARDTVVAIEGWTGPRTRGARPQQAEGVLRDVLGRACPDVVVNDVVVQFQRSPVGVAWEAEVHVDGGEPGVRSAVRAAVPEIESAFNAQLARPTPERVR